MLRANDGFVYVENLNPMLFSAVKRCGFSKFLSDKYEKADNHQKMATTGVLDIMEQYCVKQRQYLSRS